LSPSIYATMQRPAKGTYGFGWIVVYRSWARGNMLSHAGSNTMNYAASWLGPAVGYGVLVCTNQGGKLNSAANEVAGTLLNLHAMRRRTKIGRDRSSAHLILFMPPVATKNYDHGAKMFADGGSAVD
jgi:hypothetical protein